MKIKNNILIGVILFISCINKINANAINEHWINSNHSSIVLKVDNKITDVESDVTVVVDIDMESDISDSDDEVIDIESDVLEVVDVDMDTESDVFELNNEESNIETGIPEINTDIFDIETGIPEINTDIFDIETGIPEMNTDIFDIETGIPEFDEGDIETETDVVYSDTRLPENVLPVAYRLDFYTSIENSTFDGKEEIDIEILKETNSIIFHSENLSLSNITISNENEILKPNSIQYIKESNFVTLNFNETLKSETNYTLHMQYSGKLNSNGIGYFIEEYDNEDDSQSRMAATQFEAADARRAFPCFDEPQLKATFQLNMTVNDGYNALSNMNVVEIKEIKNLNLKQKKYIFANSVKMSTYLVAFMVSKFQSISDKYNDIDVSVYVIPDLIEDAKYSLKVAIKLLEFYENLLKIPYPLPKLDLVGVPNLVFGGMENWGLINFRSESILWNEETGTDIDKYGVVTLIAHEIAHQWFGNIVTMKWWDDFWLNEGFANIATDVVEPELGITNNWYYEYYSIFSKDTLDKINSVYNYSPNPKYLNDWDIISIYNKGESIIRMMEFWLNKMNDNHSISTTSIEDNYFYKRIHEYLDLYRYNNVDSQQLYEMLESYDENGQPLYHVSGIMESFIKQKGIPIVMMERISNDHDQIITLSQEQLISINIDQYEMDNIEQKDTMIKGNSTWVIPYSYSIYSNSTGKPELLESHYITLEDNDDRKSKTTISLPTKDDEATNTKIFIKGNEDQKGYYLVQYDDESIQVACEWLKSDLNFMSYINRAGFISDIFNQLLENRAENPTTILNCLDYLKNEKSTIVWIKILKYFKRLIYIRYENNMEKNKLIMKYISDLTKNIFEDIGWVEKEKEGIEKKSGIEDNTIINRDVLRSNLMDLGDQNENNRAKALYYYNEIKNGTYSENFDEYILINIFETGIKYGNVDESDIDFILNELDSETSKFDKYSLMSGLKQVSDASLRKKILEKFNKDIENGFNLDDYDYQYFKIELLTNWASEDYYLYFTFVRDHWDDYFKEKYLNDNYELIYLIETIYSKSKKEDEHFQEIASWINVIDKEEKKINLEDEIIDEDHNNNNLENEENDDDPIILWLKEHY
ncbi:peptidase family M1-domain-containing protein [Neocallimastix sp. 'constans']